MTAETGVLGVGFDANSSFRRGAAEAPARIRAALGSEAANAYSETGVRVWPSEHVVDHGDLDIPAEANSRTPIDTIEAGAAAAMEGTPFLVALGGDHAVTYPLLRAVARRHGKVSLLHFDAHPDMYPDFEGNPFSHASPMARILEEGLVDRLVQVGIRSFAPSQQEVAIRHGVEVHPPFTGDLAPPLKFTSPTYISIDVDGLDPAFAPGVSHPEPGGLSVRQIVDLVHGIEAPSVIGGDLVELNPSLDTSGITAIVAAKLTRELLGRVVRDAQGVAQR